MPWLTFAEMLLSGTSFRRLLVVAFWTLALAACGPATAPAYFVPPTSAGLPSVPLPTVDSGGVVIPAAPTSGRLPTIAVPTPTPPCTDGLTYNHDITIPDGTNFAPGQPIDKQWLVTNSGTCNWDARYRLKLVGGDPMAASPLQALFPARAGTQATIRIVFTAPQQAGFYQSQWQAMNPDGVTFGDPFYIQIAVSS